MFIKALSKYKKLNQPAFFIIRAEYKFRKTLPLMLCSNISYSAGSECCFKNTPFLPKELWLTAVHKNGRLP